MQVKTKGRALLEGLAQTLEVPTMEPSTLLLETRLWDSMSVVATIALIDELEGPEVEGERLAACLTAGDILKLTGFEL